MQHGHFACVAFFLVNAATALRDSSRAQEQLQSQAQGCKGQETCESCLQSAPFLWGGEYCKWCPEDYWYGVAHAHAGNVTGVCRAATFSEAICGGGTKWIYTKKSSIDEAQEPTEDHWATEWPARATDLAEAQKSCPYVDNDFGVQNHLRPGALSDLTGQNLSDPATLETTLARLNLDLQRLNRLRITNPSLFKSHFSSNLAMRIAQYSWKAAVWGVTWVPLVGGGISLGLGIITAATEATHQEVEYILERHRESQRMLCSKGKTTTLPYFSDVTFGMLNEQYEKVREEATEEVEMQQNETLNSSMVGNVGRASTKVSEALSGNGAKAAKALLHTGLFIGGFFSFGITWLVGSGLGGAELMAEWSAQYAAAKSISMKMFLLTALARQLDASTWASNQTRCDITDVDRAESPCPTVVRPDGSGKVHRVCSRSSPWNHHLEHIPDAELTPEGRCLPRASVGLENGLPCLTHEACTSGYCHFEPMIQYFFSDHKRAPCPKKAGAQSCTNVFDQLLALQVSSVRLNNTPEDDLWNVRPENFTDTYKGSFQGPVYATTGTCATACPREEVGKGSCAGISLGGTDLDKKIPVLGRFEFGVRQSNRIFSGWMSFEYVGNGLCGGMADSLDDDDLHERFEPFDAKTEVTMDRASSPEELLQACADYCRDDTLFACMSFSAHFGTDAGHVCEFYDRVAETSYDTGPSRDNRENIIGSASCYAATESWPLDIYQPWNFEWSKYLLMVQQVVKYLDSENPVTWGHALAAVRKAYPGYCRGMEHCLHPEEWEPWYAVNMLRHTAPLSFQQLSAVIKEISPESAESIAMTGDRIKVSDMIKRPNGFGAAWKSFLGPYVVKQAREQAQKEPHAQGSMRDKVWVQRMEARAFQYKLRTHDGFWDLEAANRQLRVEQAASESPKRLLKRKLGSALRIRRESEES